MADTNYILDTNILSALLRMSHPKLIIRISQHQREALILCDCIIYELERGLVHRGAEKLLRKFERDLFPLFSIIPITHQDWRQAATYWATTRANGKQLSDMDLLIGAVAKRLNGIVVTDDNDFQYLPLKTENWLHDE
jgi:predicted nucleic acid-binding protein